MFHALTSERFEPPTEAIFQPRAVTCGPRGFHCYDHWRQDFGPKVMIPAKQVSLTKLKTPIASCTDLYLGVNVGILPFGKTSWHHDTQKIETK